MIFSFVAPTYVNASSEVQWLTHNGIVYEITTTYDAFGNRVVAVFSEEGIVTVVNDGLYLHITEQNTLTRRMQEHKIRLEPYVPTNFPAVARNSITGSTRFWGYMWMFSSTNPPIPTLGDGWGLWAGAFGTAIGHDGNRANARNAAMSFMREVDTIATEQYRAIAVLGAGGASLVASALTTATGFTLGGIVALLTTLGLCITASTYWYTASRARTRAQVYFSIFRTHAILN